jgi:hypothetical protein
MMGRWILFAALLCMLTLYANSAPAQEMEPEEPEIVLPSIVLEIEDLSVEKVRSGLPESEELPTPWREHPLPEPGELEIEESSLEILAPDEGSPAYAERTDFVAETIIGTGVPNHFFSSISLHKYGELPEGNLFFQHEVADGFSDNPQGSGFNSREDTLEGMVKFALGDFDIKTSAEFSDFERGLQGQGTYYSKLNRSVSGAVTAQYGISEQFLLKGNFDGWVASQLLTGTPSGEQTQELLISPRIRGELLMENWYIGLTPRLSYRNVPDNPDLQVTRVGVNADFGITLGEKYRIDGGVGWFYSRWTDHLVPFHLAITLTPSELFSLQAKGGYKIVEYNLIDIFDQYIYSAVPALLIDNHGWFFDLGSRLFLSDRWMFSADLSFMDENGMLTVDQTTDPTSGLFTPNQVEALRLGVTVGARWNITRGITADFGAASQFLDNPAFFPQHKISADLEGTEQSGRYGGGILSSLFLGEHRSIQAPVIDLYGFYRPADFVKLSIEISDLLLPIVRTSRYSWYPYIEKGFGITLKAQINF